MRHKYNQKIQNMLGGTMLCHHWCRLVKQHLGYYHEVPVVVIVAFLACVLASDMSHNCTQFIATSGSYLTGIKDCRFLIIHKNLILQFCYFESNCENIKSQTPKFCYNLIYFTTVLKKGEISISVLGVFSQFYLDVNSLCLIRNLQYTTV